MGLHSQLSTDFDGINDHIVIGDVAPFDFERTDPFSVSAWVKTVTAFDFDTIVSKLSGIAPFNGWEFLVDAANNEIVFQLINTVPTNFLRMDTNGASPDPTDGFWHHIVGTYDGSSTPGGVTIYIDAVSQSLTTVTNNLSATTLNSIPLQIGARDGTGLAFGGNIDDVSIYDKELSGAEIDAIYNAGTPRDNRLLATSTNLIGYWTMGDGDTYPTLRDRQVANPILAAGSIQDRSVNSNDGTPTNMEDADFTSDTPGGVSSYSTTFDGVDEYIDMGNVSELDFAHTDPFSISVWIKFSTAPAAASYVLVAKSQDTGDYRGYVLGIMDAGGGDDTSVFLTIRNAVGDRLDVRYVTDGLDDSAWHHILCTYDGSTDASGVEILVDGVDQTTTIAVDTLTATSSNSAPFQLAARDGFTGVGTNDWYLGQMDEVAVFDKKLSSNEIEAVYNSGTPHDLTMTLTYPNLVGYWNMGEDANDGTMTFMDPVDIEADFPLGIVPGCEVPFPGVFSTSKDLGEIIAGTTWGSTAGDPGGSVTVYKMRALQDPGPGYHVWISTGTPDFLGTGAPGAIQVGTAVVADQWFQ